MTGDRPLGTDAAGPRDDDFVPESVDDLVAYVDGSETGIAVLWWVDDGARRTTLAFDVTAVPSSVGDAGRPAVDVRRVTDDPPVAHPVPVASVEAARAIPTADAATEALPTSPRARAEALRGLAERGPDLVDVGVVLRLLADCADATARVSSLQSLTALAEERPENCLAAVPTIARLVTDTTDHAVRGGALTCLAALAAARPEEVAPHVESAFAALDASGTETALVTAAVTCVSHVAGADPDAVVDATDRLVRLVSAADATVRMHAAYALGRVAVVAPEAVRADVAALVGVVGDESERTATRLNAACAVGRVAGEWPASVVESLPTFVGALDDEDAAMRANAAGVVGDVATVHAVAVRRHVDSLLGCLDDDDHVTRANGSTALARVAREFPAAVAEHVDRFVDALDDDEPLVRENVCWTLGYLRDEARPARSVLERVRTDDGDERVRSRAAWALDEVDPGGGLGASD